MQWFKFDPTVVGTIVEDLDLAGQGAYFKLMRALWLTGPLSEADVRRKCGATYDQVRELMDESGDGLSFEWIESLRVDAQGISEIRSAVATLRHSKQKDTNDMQLHANAMQLPSMSSSISTSDSSSKSQERKELAKPDDGFDEFYLPYPNKKARGAAERAWAKMTKDERALCRPAIEAQVKANHFRGTDGKDYIPHPATWLNERRWQDEVRTSAATAIAAVPLTKDQARARLDEIRLENNIDPGGFVPVNLMPKEVKDVIWR
jgi:hypothetical protein